MGPAKPIIDITPEPSPSFPGRDNRSPRRDGLSSLIVRRNKSFFVIFFGTLITAVAWFLLQPQSYRATGTVLLSRSGSVPSQVTESELESEAEIVRSQAGALAGANLSAQVTESAESAELRKQRTRERIHVDLAGKSQVLRISYTDGSRLEALAKANLLIDLYLQQRFQLLSAPPPQTAADPESMAIYYMAEQANRELQQFDQKNRGLSAVDEYRARSARRAALESKMLELRTVIRGHEELLRRQPQTAEAENQLASLRAQANAYEAELAKLEKLDSKVSAVVAEREGLRIKAEHASAQSDFITRRMQELRLAGVNLQARLLTRAEVVAVTPFEVTWYYALLCVLAALSLGIAAAFLMDRLDRPVYSEDHLSDLAGVPPLRTSDQDSEEDPKWHDATSA